MKASDLIRQLQELVETDGDLDVRLYTDHGQCAMRANWVSVTHIEEDEYMTDTIHPDDLDDYDNPIKVIEIQA